MKKFIDTILTLGKVIIKSRPTKRLSSETSSGSTALVILGNGPSLRTTLADNSDALKRLPLMAVNFAANTPEFLELKPERYILADPHFFTGNDPNVQRLWQNLRTVSWPLTLHLPAIMKRQVAEKGLPGNISVQFFNMTPAQGYDFVCRPLYRRGLAMPRPRNVLIPAIMEGIRVGFKEIYIAGADHTWPHTLYVDDLNRVVSVQPHFYEDDRKELDRVAQEYAGLRLHEVLGSMVIAFRSYHDVKRYADALGVCIYNSTPGSLIDAFPRQPLGYSRSPQSGLK